VARSAGDDSYLAMALSVKAGALQQLGEAARAIEAIDESVELRRAAGDANLAIPLFRRAELRAAAGATDDALSDLAEAEGHAAARGNGDQRLRARLLGAVVAAEAGREGALSRLAQCIDEASNDVDKLRPPTRELLERARGLMDTTTPR
jgi:tetratricopeptide (TPR) repeat protein